MCGIAGLVSLQQPLDGNAPATIARMIEALNHRGPDDRGSYLSAHVALANTRLSIVGVDDGHQPIANETGDVITVMNGEIYNAPQLRAELQRKGHVFKTKTDTEVLVHLYEEEGDGFLKRLEGMFALALFDAGRTRLILARDRFGMKPLVISRLQGGFAFASEINALRGVPGFSDALSPEGLSTYLGLMYVPDPWTIYRDTQKLAPGTALIADRSGEQTLTYYDVRFTGSAKLSRADAEEALSRLIPEAVERHLMADVPIATLLSGGLDSRSVTAAMWLVGYPSTAFTVGYREGRFDESGMAARWIEMIGGRHETLMLSEEVFAAGVLARYRQLGEPYAVWVNGASAALAQLIYSRGFKVALTGEGGDEFFCGYPTLHAANLMRTYRVLPRRLRGTVRALTNRLPAGGGRLSLSFMAKSFVNADDGDLIRAFFGFKEVIPFRRWREALTPEALKLIGGLDPALAFDQYRARLDGWPLTDALSYLDIKVFLAGCSLVPNDNAFMSGSVETRIPLLDYSLVDFVTSLPLSLRFDPLAPKSLLKGAMRRFLDRHFSKATAEIKRYKKMGFEVPITDWIKGPHLGRLIEERLSEKRVAANGFFRPNFVRRTLDDQAAGRANNERMIQSQLAMEVFLEPRAA